MLVVVDFKAHFNSFLAFKFAFYCNLLDICCQLLLLLLLLCCAHINSCFMLFYAFGFYYQFAF